MKKKNRLVLKRVSLLIAISLCGYRLYQNRRDNFTHRVDYCVFNNFFSSHQGKMVVGELKHEKFYVYQVPFTVVDVDYQDKVEEFSYRSKDVVSAYEIDSKKEQKEGGGYYLVPTDRLIYYFTYEIDLEILSQEELDYPCLGEYIPSIDEKIILIKEDNQLKWVSIKEAYQSEEEMKKIIGFRDLTTINNYLTVFNKVYINDEINPLLTGFDDKNMIKKKEPTKKIKKYPKKSVDNEK